MPENYKYSQEVKHRMKLVGWKRLLANPIFFWYTVCIPFGLFWVTAMTTAVAEVGIPLLIGDGEEMDLHSQFWDSKLFEKGFEIYLYLLNLLFILRLWIFYNCNKTTKIFFYNHFMGILCCLNLTLNNILFILHVDFRLTGILVIDIFVFLVGGYVVAIIVTIYFSFSNREEWIYTTLVRLEEKTKVEIYIDKIVLFVGYIGGFLFILIGGCIFLVILYVQIIDFPYYETGKDIKSFFIKKNYSIELNDDTKEIYVNMRCPSIGIVGINEEGYDGFTHDEVEEQLFEDIRHNSYEGDWKVFVRLEYKDSYGNY